MGDGDRFLQPAGPRILPWPAVLEQRGAGLGQVVDDRPARSSQGRAHALTSTVVTIGCPPPVAWRNFSSNRLT